jgi:hypothetical protein
VVCGFCEFSGRAETILTDLPDRSTEETPHPIDLPSLPALTTLVIDLCACDPSPQLTRILRSIGSAPALTSIVIEYFDWNEIAPPSPEDPWADVDGWLSRIAEHAKVEGGLALTLTGWPKGMSVMEGFLPEFGKSGGELKVDHDSWCSQWSRTWASPI